EEPVEPVHPQEDAPAVRRLQNGRDLRQDLEERLHRGVVVRGVGLQERERGAEGDGLRDELARTDARIVGALRYLPDRPARALAGPEQGDRRAVELRRAHQLQTELERGKPEAQCLPALRGSALPYLSCGLR